MAQDGTGLFSIVLNKIKEVYKRGIYIVESAIAFHLVPTRASCAKIAVCLGALCYVLGMLMVIALVELHQYGASVDNFWMVPIVVGVGMILVFCGAIALVWSEL